MSKKEKGEKEEKVPTTSDTPKAKRTDKRYQAAIFQAANRIANKHTELTVEALTQEDCVWIIAKVWNRNVKKIALEVMLRTYVEGLKEWKAD